MRTHSKRLTGALTALALLPLAAAHAVPSITPPAGARLAPGQLFDLRVTGTGLSSVTVDGSPATLSGDTYSYRALSFTTPGTHTIVATDSTGSNTRKLAVLPVVGGSRHARNIIILLGDGMGIQHRTAARIVRYGLTNGIYNGRLAMDTMPAVGLISTSSLTSLVTDSAPGMANYVTGSKQANNQEGVFPDSTADAFDNPRIEYLSEYLHRTQGKSLGIVSTADIEDATPAANAVHTSNRNAGTGICDQYLDESGRTGLTVLLGGGRRWFLPATDPNSSRSTATDYVLPSDVVAAYGVPAGALDPNRNLIGDFQTAGFTYVSDRTSLLANAAGSTKLLGLFGYGNMNVAYDKLAKRRAVLAGDTAANKVVDDYQAPDQPMLDEMTDAALTVLNKNTNGFVLMVEGAHIDKQSHAMDADRVLYETIEFDHAVRRALDFARADGNTLVIVTADHECSGFSILGALAGGIANLKALPSDAAITSPTTAPARQGVVTGDGFPSYTILQSDPSLTIQNGVSATAGVDQVYNGFPQSADIDGKLLIGYGANADRYEGWLSKPVPIIDSLLPASIAGQLATKGYPAQPVNRQAASTTTDPLGDSRGFFIRGQVAGRAQAAHTASDIPLTAYSSGTRAFQQFVGVQDNTDVFFSLARAALGGY